MRALDIAIDALDGVPLVPIPAVRPRLARKLREVRRELLRMHIIWR